MNDFKKLGKALIGQGIEDHETLVNIDRFLERYPTIAQDQGYVDYLNRYSGAVLDWTNEKFEIVTDLLIEIYGFINEISINIAYPDEPLTEDGGFFRFAETGYLPDFSVEKTMGCSYAFDITGDRKTGIYQSIFYPERERNVPYQWFCGSFIEWFAQLVEKKGILFEL